MKVTVCFDDTKVVVPCGDGSNSIQHLINEALSRYRKVAPKGRDLCHLDINDMNLSLKDGGILDPDDKIADVLEDKEQILAVFQENEKDLISSILDLKTKVQGHSSPILESPKNEAFEDSIQDDVYCIITAEDLKSDSRLRVKKNVESPIGVQSNFRIFLDENLNHISKLLITKGKFLEKSNENEKPIIIGDEMSDLGKLVEMVTLKNESPILGIHVMPEYDDNEDLTGLKVRSIEKDGLADKDGRLKCGDVIIEINNVSLYKVDFAEAQEIFKCARDDPELHLKVIHKGRNALNEDVGKQEHDPQKIKEMQVIHQEPPQDKKPDLVQQRKEFASMVDLSHNRKEPKDIYSSHTIKSVSMNDLMGNSDFYQDKVYSSLSEDECDDDDLDGPVAMSKSQKKSMKLKEMFANDQRFNRRRAYDSLNRAVDKSIDELSDPSSKEKNKKGIYKGVKPDPAKKQRWWSRLKLNKKSKDDSKKTKKEPITNGNSSPSKTLVVDKPAQSKSKNYGNTSNNTNNSFNKNSNNNNNNNISNNDHHGHDDNKSRKDKSSIEWMHRVSWLASTSESLESQANSPTSKAVDLKQPGVKMFDNGKVVNRTENEFENISENKMRSRSAVRTEIEASGGFNQSKAIVQTKTIHDSQTQSRSFSDLSTKEARNGNTDGLSGDRSNISGRAISHYKADGVNFQELQITRANHNLPATRGDSKHDLKLSGPSEAEMSNRPGAPYSCTAREKLFGKSNAPDYLVNKRLPIVLKESHHRGGLVIPRELNKGDLNNTSIYRPIPSASRIPININQQHQSHLILRDANAMPKYHDQRSNFSQRPSTTANQKRSVVQSDPNHNLIMEHPSVYGPSVNGKFQNGIPKPYHRQPMSHMNPQVILPPPPISDHFIPSMNNYMNYIPHRANERFLEEHVHFQPYSDRVQQRCFNDNPQQGFNDNPQQGFYHVQQSSDVTDYGNGFHRVVPGRRRDSYDVRR